MCEYLFPTATTDAPMPSPVGIQFVNETPKIDRGSVLVNFMTMGSTDTVLCELGDYYVVEDCKLINNKFNHVAINTLQIPLDCLL